MAQDKIAPEDVKDLLEAVHAEAATALAIGPETFEKALSNIVVMVRYQAISVVPEQDSIRNRPLKQRDAPPIRLRY